MKGRHNFLKRLDEVYAKDFTFSIKEFIDYNNTKVTCTCSKGHITLKRSKDLLYI